jgi:chromosome segregation ATPase
MNRRSQAGLAGFLFLTLLAAGCASKDLRSQLDDRHQQLQRTDRILAGLQLRVCELEASLAETQVSYDDAARENRELATALVAAHARLSAVERERDETIAALRAESEDGERAAVARAELAGARFGLYDREIAERDAKLVLKDAEAAELERSIAVLESNSLANGDAIESLSGEKAALSAELEAAVAGRTKIAVLLGVLLAFFVGLSVAEFVAVRRARHAHAHV